MAQGVTVGNATKIAADLVATAATTGRDINELIGLVISTTSTLVEAMDSITDGTPSNVVQLFPQQQQQAPASQPDPVQAVTNAFPGSTVIAPPQAAQAAPAAPAPVPGVQQQGPDPEVAALWNQLLSDVQTGQFQANWYDNRADKTNPRAPDFKRKSDKAALWLQGKKNPANLPQLLSAVGLA